LLIDNKFNEIGDGRASGLARTQEPWVAGDVYQDRFSSLCLTRAQVIS
jgi:hypothetical protein